jgi:hypothetical protein
MNTSGRQTFQYGRIEARMKLQVGDGFWPAFWMLSNNIGSVGWPTSGEQDIMEWVQSYGPSTTSSTIHRPGYSGGNGTAAGSPFPMRSHRRRQLPHLWRRLVAEQDAVLSGQPRAAILYCRSSKYLNDQAPSSDIFLSRARGESRGADLAGFVDYGRG